MIRLSVPGKTFLVGEYLALSGGPSLVLATSPRFVLEVERAKAEFPFHPLSPAGRLRALDSDLGSYSFRFTDPHNGRGGLGASTAQYALLWAFQQGLRKLDPQKINWAEVLERYRELAWSGSGEKPSGADLVAQLSGGVTDFDGERYQVQIREWLFPELSFSLLRTGAKLATHDHLKSVKPREAALRETLRALVFRARNSLTDRNEAALVEAVRGVRKALHEAGLTAPQSHELLLKLESNPAVLAAKGCGAMGADILLVLHSRSRADEVRVLARNQGLELCGEEKDLAQGLEQGLVVEGSLS